MININSLFDKKRARQTQRIRMFSRLLKKCHMKITLASQIEQTSCIYIIPYIVVGMPMYNFEECKKYITTHLTENGFIVEVFADDTLLISWEHHDIE